VAARKSSESMIGGRRIPRVRARDVARDWDALRDSETARRVRPPALAPRERPGPRRHPRAFRLFPVRLESETAEPAGARVRERRYRRLLAVADVIAAASALVIAIPLLGNGDAISPWAAASVPLIVVISKVLGLYDRDELLLRKTTLDEAPALFQLSTLSALLLWLGHTVFVEGELGRDQVMGFWGLLFLCLVGARFMARSLARRSTPLEAVLLLGDPGSCERVREKIEQSSSIHARVVAQVVLEAATEAQDAAAALAHVVAEREVHRVVIAPRSVDHGEILDVIRAAKALGLKVSVLPRMLEVVGSSVEFDDVDGLGVLGVRRFGLTRSSWLVKRTMDLAGSVAALVFLAPVMVLIALAIKLTSRGPVFFRQRRVGRDGRIFPMLKFRTMVADAEARKAKLEALNEAHGLFKIADDPRVTRVGGFLRRTSLDELPQLVNVLRGEMSLVGPRPLVLEDDKRVEGWYRRRLDLTPGMTGRWQVLGSARIPLNEMVKLDYLYVANWSLWADVKILLRTVQFVVGRRGL
jgi:exopolysaccharide biosynthesis polyprenyl glycosylphosphotransferase